MQRAIWAIAVLATFLLGLYTGTRICLSRKAERKTQIDVMIGQIKEILKIGYVEGEYSDMMSIKEYNWFDLSPLRKSAIIRVKAKVIAGFDLSQAAFQADEKTKTLTVSIPASPEILSVEHKLDYYDLHQGTFNSFTQEELNAMQATAVDMIKQKAMESDLLARAAQRHAECIQWLQNWLAFSGWKLEFTAPSEHSNKPFELR